MCSLILGLAISFSISSVLEFSSSCFSSSCLCSSVGRQSERLREAEKHQPSVSYRVFKVTTLTIYHSEIIFQIRPFYFNNSFTVSGEIWTLSVLESWRQEKWSYSTCIFKNNNCKEHKFLNAQQSQTLTVTTVTHLRPCLGLLWWRSDPPVPSDHHAGLSRSELTQKNRANIITQLIRWWTEQRTPLMKKVRSQLNMNIVLYWSHNDNIVTSLTECHFGVSSSVQFCNLLLKFSLYLWWKQTHNPNQKWNWNINHRSV